MCRLYGFLANEPTKVECTLVHAQNALLHQSREDLGGRTHSDGWGISCYPNGMPQRERRAHAAHEDLWFSTTAERTYSHAVIAHVRRATVGGARVENTHPFIYGCWTFAHNGTIADFDKLEPYLLEEVSSQLRQSRQGTTDSELLFLWLMTQFAAAAISPTKPCSRLDKLVRVLSHSLVELAQRSASSKAISQLNFMLTDGRSLLATRWNHTLHFVSRVGLHDCEVCGIPHVKHEATHEYRACVIASEPISHEPWEEVANHSLLLVDSQIGVQHSQIG